MLARPVARANNADLTAVVANAVVARTDNRARRLENVCPVGVRVFPCLWTAV